MQDLIHESAVACNNATHHKIPGHVLKIQMPDRKVPIE